MQGDGIVDQQIEPPLLTLDLIKQRLHLLIIGVITGNGDPLPSGTRHRFGRFPNRAGQHLSLE